MLTPSRHTAEKADRVDMTKQEQLAALDQLPWREDYHPGLASSLGRKKVRGCGEFVYKLMPGTDSEYLVACIGMDGKKAGYLVWPNVDGVVGPIDLSK